MEKYSKRELYEDDTYYIVPVYSGDETYWVALPVLLLDRRDKADWNKVYKADMKNSMGQYDPAQAVVIGSATFPKDYFAAVNSYVEQNDKEQAIKELQSLFKIRSKTAQAIVESWSVYYK